MKPLIIATLCLLGATHAISQDLAEEFRYLGFLSSLQFVETPDDLKNLIPEFPAPTADAGDGNTEILVKTKLFGFDATGEFNFHQGILVSHGFEVLTSTYEEAHRTFLDAITLLNEQVKGLKVSATLPLPLGDEDPSDGPQDEINLLVEGVAQNASFQVRMEMRRDSLSVRWGAQKVSSAENGEGGRTSAADGQ